MIEAGVIKRVHVNQHNIKHNAKADPEDWLPVFTVKTSSKNYRAVEVDLCGASSTVYRPHKPLSCGAKVWIETTAKVVVTLP